MIARLLMTVFLTAAVVGLSSCTAQERARNWGGSATVDLPAGRKLVLVTWKEDSIWYLTKPMKETDVAETYEFTESSSWGMQEGKVIIKEKK
jgi:hypothetical protein